MLECKTKLTQDGSSLGHVSSLPAPEEVPGDVSQHNCSPHAVGFVYWIWLARIEAAAREEEVDLTRQYTLHPALTQTSLTAVLSSGKISHKI